MKKNKDKISKKELKKFINIIDSDYNSIKEKPSADDQKDTKPNSNLQQLCNTKVEIENKQETKKRNKKDNIDEDALRQIKQREKKLKTQRELEMNEISQRWYKLDNSALIYPAIRNAEWNSVFRLSAVLKDKINVEKLQQALDLTIDRFPFFNVSLRDGLFWHYFQSLTEKPKVQLETESPCRPFVFKKNMHLLRVLYYNNKISLEIFHSLSDGYGAIQFLNVLIITYLELNGIEIPDKSNYGYNAYDKPTKEEGEDSFKRYYNKRRIRSRKERKAYAIKDELLEQDTLRVFNGSADIKELKAIAKSYNTTINEFLSATYLSVLLEHKKLYGKTDKKPVKLSVPVNIRGHLPSKTMRNFALVLNVEIPHEKTYASFEEIIEIVKAEMKKLDDDYIYGFIGRNVQSEKLFIVRILPLFVKEPIMKLIYSQVGEILFTSTISNMGLVKLPQAVTEQIVEYQAVLGATKLNKINLAVISVGDTITITLTSRLKDNSLAREFYKKLAGFGLKLRIESNT